MGIVVNKKHATKSVHLFLSFSVAQNFGDFSMKRLIQYYLQRTLVAVVVAWCLLFSVSNVVKCKCAGYFVNPNIISICSTIHMLWPLGGTNKGTHFLNNPSPIIALPVLLLRLDWCAPTVWRSRNLSKSHATSPCLTLTVAQVWSKFWRSW